MKGRKSKRGYCTENFILKQQWHWHCSGVPKKLVKRRCFWQVRINQMIKLSKETTRHNIFTWSVHLVFHWLRTTDCLFCINWFDRFCPQNLNVSWPWQLHWIEEIKNQKESKVSLYFLPCKCTIIIAHCSTTCIV